MGGQFLGVKGGGQCGDGVGMIFAIGNSVGLGVGGNWASSDGVVSEGFPMI